MGLKRRLTGGLCAGLAALLTVQPVSAFTLGLYEGLTGFSLFESASLDTEIAAGLTLSEEEAALRLYYLHLITGTGVNSNGGVDFDLNRGLSRLEAAVFAVRLMGAEAEAEETQCAHPYEDVPGWASPYVGYMYNRGLLGYIGGRQYEPNAAVSCDEFMSYMLYALGFRMSAGDYTLLNAASLARSRGICVTGEDEPLTRGGACVAMYNTLRATMKDSDRVLSDLLVERGLLSYQDAVFLLWSEDQTETQRFMDAVGYGIEWIVPDGYYTITSAESGQNLNVAVTGVNSDYEGVGVTLWEETEDVTQYFRLERTERGTYLIYSAASKSGFGRVIGSPEASGGSCVGAEGGGTGLFQATSGHAMEYYIEGSVDGTWTILAADDLNLALSCQDPGRNGAPVTLERRGYAPSQTWNFERRGIMNSYGEELAIFCCHSLVVTQGAFDEYSHMEQNALDIQPTEGRAFAPFTGRVVAIQEGEATCNAVWFESAAPVRYADGTYDYMTVCFLHDDDVSDLAVGMGFQQGDWLYDSGNTGNSSGAHIHVAVYRGRYSPTMHLGSGDVFAEDAFFLMDDVYVRDDYGLDWVVVSRAESVN